MTMLCRGKACTYAVCTGNSNIFKSLSDPPTDLNNEWLVWSQTKCDCEQCPSSSHL